LTRSSKTGIVVLDKLLYNTPCSKKKILRKSPCTMELSAKAMRK
jgi:hypothetical protein